MIKEERKFDIEDRLIDFAVMIAEIVETLPNTKDANHIKNVWNFLLSFQKVLKLPERILIVAKVRLIIKRVRQITDYDLNIVGCSFGIEYFLWFFIIR